MRMFYYGIPVIIAASFPRAWLSCRHKEHPGNTRHRLPKTKLPSSARFIYACKTKSSNIQGTGNRRIRSKVDEVVKTTHQADRDSIHFGSVIDPSSPEAGISAQPFKAQGLSFPSQHVVLAINIGRTVS